MASKRLMAILFTALVFSCTEQETTLKIPQNIVDQEKMAAVLCDLSVMEASLNVARFNGGNPAADSLRFNIYRQHNISRSTYDSSIAFYSKHPEEFKKVYAMAVDKLSSMQ